jgi:hypothetical protein
MVGGDESTLGRPDARFGEVPFPAADHDGDEEDERGSGTDPALDQALEPEDEAEG